MHRALVSGSANPEMTTSGRTIQSHSHQGSADNQRPGQDEINAEDEEIDILVATDCISEGRNLQEDCDALVNSADVH